MTFFFFWWQTAISNAFRQVFCQMHIHEFFTRDCRDQGPSIQDVGKFSRVFNPTPSYRQFFYSPVFTIIQRLQKPGEDIAFTARPGHISNPNPKYLGSAEAYFICHIGQEFQISLNYAFIGRPQSVLLSIGKFGQFLTTHS